VENSPAKTVLLCEVTGVYAAILTVNEAGGANNYHSAVTNIGNGDNVFVIPFAGTVTGGNLTTGCVGGEAASCPPGANIARHTEGSNFLMCDGHAKWLRGSAVSSGSVAFAEDCNQEGNPSLTDCASNGGMAAGTGNSNYAVTFSPI
jgi:prepilin-type processing-associated H-X9-DG protein